MAVWHVRCRGPTGQSTLSVSPEMSVSEFQGLVQVQTGVTQARQELLAGFPPKVVQLPEGACLSGTSLTNGDTITVRELSAPPAATTVTQPTQAVASPGAPAAPPSQPHSYYPPPSPGPGGDDDDDAQLALAIAASLADNHLQAAPTRSEPGSHTHSAVNGYSQEQHTAGAAAVTSSQQVISHQQAVSHQQAMSQQQAPVQPNQAPTSVVLSDGSAVVRRVIDSDNSCLFNAVGYCTERSRTCAPQLRQLVANAVQADPVTYNEGFLGKENEDYVKWILGKDKWGGAIELSILSSHFQLEIAAFDTQTKRMDVYGQDAGYKERIMLIYDGLHYDALALAAFMDAPEVLDVTIHELGNTQASEVERGAARLVEACHQARAFTDTANFTLRCGVCLVGLKGEKEALVHAKATGHQNFQEY